MKVLIFATHPVQYQVPIYRELAKYADLVVVYMHRQNRDDQAKSGFGVAFEWDVPLYSGYNFEYLENTSTNPSTGSYFGIRVKGLKKIFDRQKPDKVVVQGWFPFGYIQVIRYCKKRGIEVICRGDSNLLMKVSPLKLILKQLYIRWLFAKIDKFLYVGQRNFEFYKYYGVSEKKLFFSPHCIDTFFFKRQYSQIPRSKHDDVVIGFVGKFIPKKQPQLIVEALSNSTNKKRCRLLFVGDGELKETIQKLGFEKHVKIEMQGFLNQSEICEKGYCKMDFIVLPSSHNETWGLVINEAMTGGIPAIVSDLVGCAKDLIDENETGYIFRFNDVEDLTKKLDLMIESILDKKDYKSAVFSRIEKYSLNACVNGFIKALEIR